MSKIASYQRDKDHYRITFMSQETKTKYYCSEDSIKETVDKRIKAYNLIPEGCTIIPKETVGLFQGWFIGGIMADSIIAVYGIAGSGSSSGIRGYSCSIYFVPSKEYMRTITVDMSTIHTSTPFKKKSIGDTL